MRENNHHTFLTDSKDVKVVEFNGVRYVNFHRTYKKDDKVFDTYINMKDEEWLEFLKALDSLDVIIPTDNIQPCSDCFLLKKVVPVSEHGGKMLSTTLTYEMLQAVRENNNVAYNQQMYQCEYCGGYSLINDDCHCHQHNCRECEPTNFCITCGALTIMAV